MRVPEEEVLSSLWSAQSEMQGAEPLNRPLATTSLVEVKGVHVSWTFWGRGRVEYVLVHGGGAHSGWWQSVVDDLARDTAVVTLDLSGHGHSGHRSVYRFSLWVEEVKAVIEAAGAHGATIVAHSMGGITSSVVAADPSFEVKTLVLVDSMMPSPPDAYFPSVSPPIIYKDAETAVSRFRFRPRDPYVDVKQAADLARESIVAVEGGWRWRFDPGIFSARGRMAANLSLDNLHVPVVAVWAPDGQVVTEDTIDNLQKRVPARVRSVRVPEAGHHFFVDRPEPLISVLASMRREHG